MPHPVVVTCRLLRNRLAPDLRDLLLLIRLVEVHSTREASLLQVGDVHQKEAAGNESPYMRFLFCAEHSVTFLFVHFKLELYV